MALGLLLGVLLDTAYGDWDFVPKDASSRVDQSFFDLKVFSSARGDSPPPVNSVVVYPARHGIQLVTFILESPTPHGQTLSSHFFFSKHTDLSEELSHSGIGFTYAWWALPAFEFLAWCFGATVVFGLLAPTLILARRNSADSLTKNEATYDASGSQNKLQLQKSPATVPQADHDYVDELERAVEIAVKTEGPPASCAPRTTDAVPLKSLSGEPLDARPNSPSADDREYKGEFYPVERPRGHQQSGFSLIELLVVIGILAVLIALILPALAKARQAATQVVCSANLRSIGQGIASYLVENQGTYPASYEYVGFAIEGGKQLPAFPVKGYVHWSSYLYGTGKMPASAFMCPAIERGGLPPADTTSDNLDTGQISGGVGVVDQQVPRLAYTLNEAICPRNKFVEGFQKANRIYQFVRASEVANSSGTILGTEFAWNAARIGANGDGTGFEIDSHRPVHGFVGTDGVLDMYKLDKGVGFRRVTADDLDPDPDTAVDASSSSSRLDWVGRNHGQRRAYPDYRKSNFLYADGHVETKTVYETLSPFQWGERFYSLVPNNDEKD